MPESARHLEMTRARQMRVDTRDLSEANFYTPIGKIPDSAFYQQLTLQKIQIWGWTGNFIFDLQTPICYISNPRQKRNIE